MSANLITLKFGFIISNGEEAAIRGACGCDSHNDEELVKNKELCRLDNMVYTLFINPLQIPLTPDIRSFAYIFRIAKHEMVHLLLCTYDPVKYSLSENVHDAEFVDILSQVDDHFYDRKLLMKKVW
jgi:hypothetical protein